MHEAITLDEIRKRGIELPKDVYTFPVDEFENHRKKKYKKIEWRYMGSIVYTHSPKVQKYTIK